MSAEVDRIEAQEVADLLDKCVCGHTRDEHNGPVNDCAARCLCDTCSPGTRNDCWCAGFRSARNPLNFNPNTPTLRSVK